MTAFFTNKRAQRIIWTANLVAVMVACSFYVTYRLGYRVNVTPSVPVGIWRLQPVRRDRLLSGIFVSFCLPESLAAFGRTRGYLETGSCPGRVLPLLKRVVAVSGDRVCTDALHTSVQRPDGWRFVIPASGRQPHDERGRSLQPIAPGCYSVRKQELWLSGDGDRRSWDSRYWGSVGVDHVLAIADPTSMIVRAIVPLVVDGRSNNPADGSVRPPVLAHVGKVRSP